MNTENNNSIKPLNEYLKDIKSRNFKFNEILPNLDKQFEKVASYDDLYKKLIEESYYLCNELITKKNHSRNLNNNGDKDLPNSNVERHLIFNSTDNLKPKPKNYEQENNKNISPINNYENKSLFFSNAKNPPQVVNEDMAYLINNCREIESLLEEQNDKIREEYESKLDNNLKQLERFKTYTELDYLENRHELDTKLSEIKALTRQFDERVDKFNEYIDTCKTTNNFGMSTYGGTYFEPVKRLTSNNMTNFGGLLSMNNNLQDGTKLVDVNNYLDTMKSSMGDAGRKIFDYIYTDVGVDSNVSQHRKKEMSGIINDLFAESKVEEATDLWKQMGYEKIEGISLEKCYDLLNYIVRQKDKEIFNLKQKIEKLDRNMEDQAQKDRDIIKLLAEVESYKLKIKEGENCFFQLSVMDNKMNKLIYENSLLYKENRRLKLLIEEYERIKLNSKHF
jgi:signal transduction histidine kinase